MENDREKLGSRLGFILLSAGCAIGLGNVWTFPWRTANNGGGAFVLIYIICCILIGLPVMTAEFSLGRKAQVSPVKMYGKLEKPGQKWDFFGYFSLAGNVFLMMFYTTIAGYFFYYLYKFISGDFAELTWNSTIANIPVNVGFMILTVAIGFFVLIFNLQTVLEKVSKWLMAGLFVLMMGLAIYACTLPGAKEGLTFYLKPDFSGMTIKTVVGALNQSFFSLSLGMGSMAIFGSYIGKEKSLMGESMIIIGLDTFVALMAGLIIFPVCVTREFAPGPNLLFTTMVAMFSDMSGGRILGIFFFLFMIFAAMSTVFAVFENILAMVRDLTGWSRLKGCIILFFAMVVLCLPMALEGSVFHDIFYFAEDGPGHGFLDLWSMLVEKIIQPLGSIAILLFCSYKGFGMGWKEFLEEANSGKGLKVKDWMFAVYGIIAPVIIFAIWVYGLLTYGW